MGGHRPDHGDAHRKLPRRGNGGAWLVRNAAARRRHPGRPRIPPLADRHREVGTGFDEYVGADRNDTRTSLGAALTYKFNCDLSLKGEYRYDWLRSNVTGVDYNASVILIGLKLQR